jgi:hypothetical protein
MKYTSVSSRVHAILSLKEDGTTTLDLCHQAIAEPHRALHLTVDLDEGSTCPTNVIGGAAIVVPFGVVVVSTSIKLCQHFVLRCARWRWLERGRDLARCLHYKKNKCFRQPK